jgi:hypothetical protein
LENLIPQDWYEEKNQIIKSNQLNKIQSIKSLKLEEREPKKTNISAQLPNFLLDHSQTSSIKLIDEEKNIASSLFFEKNRFFVDSDTVVSSSSRDHMNVNRTKPQGRAALRAFSNTNSCNQLLNYSLIEELLPIPENTPTVNHTACSSRSADLIQSPSILGKKMASEHLDDDETLSLQTKHPKL